MKNPINIAILVSMPVILALDLITPLGVAAGTPYGLVVLATLWTKKVSETVWVAIAGILFTAFGFFLSSDTVSAMHAVIINRLLAVIIILVSAILVVRYKKAHKHIDDLNVLTTTDPLTGVKNRLAFDRVLKEEILRNTRYKRSMSLALIDIDHFKNINDKFGHVVGDEVLKNVAQEIASSVRKTDTVCRLGGDEFAVIFVEADLDKAKMVGEDICKRISHNLLIGDTKVTVSIGIARLDISDYKDALYKRADEALYLSKKHGRNMISTVPIIPKSSTRKKNKQEE